MQFTTLTTFTLAISAFSTLAVADNCNSLYKYCGNDLMGIGKYHDTIVQALFSAGMAYDQEHIENTLFECKENGWILNSLYCSHGCANAGTGSKRSGYCKNA